MCFSSAAAGRSITSLKRAPTVIYMHNVDMGRTSCFQTAFFFLAGINIDGGACLFLISGVVAGFGLTGLF